MGHDLVWKTDRSLKTEDAEREHKFSSLQNTQRNEAAGVEKIASALLSESECLEKHLLLDNGCENE